MADIKDRFLQAEEQASHLARQLQELKDKIDAHTEAASSLDNARDSLSKLVGELNGVSKELPEVISALSEIDTPAILQAIERSNADLTNLVNDEYRKISRFLQVAIVVSSISIVGLVALIVLVLTR
jgi:broad specificity phosphatase PhoE